jgi:hypothetical protein
MSSFSLERERTKEKLTRPLSGHPGVGREPELNRHSAVEFFFFRKKKNQKEIDRTFSVILA